MSEPSTQLTPERYLELLRADARRLREVAERGLDADVPVCPGWTVRDVVGHTAAVYQHKIACMRSQRRPDEGSWPVAPDDGDLLGWFDASLDELVRELVDRGPRAPSYTWWEPDRTVGFWYRRMAQETAVHRVDAESAHDAVGAVDADLAVDGVDEVLRLMLAGSWDDVTAQEWGDVSPDAGAGTTVAVRTGDAGWRVSMAPDRVDVSTEPGPADAVVSGEPSEVLLWLWGRRGDEAVRVSGDAGAAAAVRARLRIATR